MKKILALLAIVAGINMMAGEAWAGGSIVLDDYKGGGMYCADDKSGCVEAIKKLLGMDQQEAENYLEDHWTGVGGLVDISDLDPGAQETLCSSRSCKWPSSDKPSGGSSSGGSSSGGSSSGGSSSGSSSSGDSAVYGSRTKYDLNDAAAAINPDGQDNTVTIGF